MNSLSKYLLSTYYLPNTILSAKSATVSKIDKVLTFRELTYSWKTE